MNNIIIHSTFKVNEMPLKYPPNLDDHSVHPGKILFEVYERSSPIKDGPLIETIELFQPEDLRHTNVLNWEQTNAVQAATSLAASTLSGSSVGKSLTSSWNSWNSGTGNFVKNITGDRARDLAMSQAGVMMNPFVSLIFRSISLRVFEFNFLLVATTEKEVLVIKDIVKAFRVNSTPSKNDTAGGILLNYPNDFKIKHIWLNEENPYLNKFKKLALTNVDTDFSAAGSLALTRIGSPAFTKLSLRFTEQSIVLSEDIEDGY